MVERCDIDKSCEAGCAGRSQRPSREGRADSIAAQQAALEFLNSLHCPYM